MCNYSDAMIKNGQIKGAIQIYRDEMNLDNKTIIEKIIRRFGLKPKDAQKYVESEPVNAKA